MGPNQKSKARAPNVMLHCNWIYIVGGRISERVNARSLTLCDDVCVYITNWIDNSLAATTDGNGMGALSNTE